MNYLVLVSKCCIFCKKSRSNQNKAIHQKDMLNAAGSLVDEAARNYDLGLIEYEEVTAIAGLSEKISMICERCNYSAARVSEFIQENYIIPVRKVLKKEERHFQMLKEKSTKEKLKKLGVMKRGNLLIIRKFQKRTFEKKGN